MRIAFLAVGAALLLGCGFGDNSLHDLPSSCGDGVKDGDEGCDDGNQVNGDGCSETCAVESESPVCGNRVVDADEQCDDGNTTSGDGCSSTCQNELATCSLLPQSGCTGSTPACDLTEEDDGKRACRAVTLSGTSDSRCTALTACSAGYSCVGELGVNSTCMKFCANDAGCSGTGSRCAFMLTDEHGGSLDVKVCSNACDIYAQSGCPPQMGCVGFDNLAGDFTDCHVMGTTPTGQPCSSALDCQAGALCVNDGGTRCHWYCKLGVASTCPSTMTCTAFASALTIGSTTYGFCR